MKKIYLDNAATTRLDDGVLEEMYSVMKTFYGNPSSTHSFGKAAKTHIEKARKTIAQIVHAEAGEIVFTSGGTEADNMILRSAVIDLDVEVIISSKIEHHAVLNTLWSLQKKEGTHIEFVALDAFGNVDFSRLVNLLQQFAGKKVLVSLMHVNNEIGNILDLEKTARLCKEYGALLHSDSVQSIHHMQIDTSEIPVDFLTASAHKFHGPKGVGFAYIRKESGLRSMITGGEQERGLRAGTEAIHNIVGLRTAFEKALKNVENHNEHLKSIKQYFMNGLKAAFPEIAFNGTSGDVEESSPAILSVRFPFPPEKGKLLLFHLDLLGGIACSAGSACQSGSNQDSHVLKAILSQEELSKASIRFSFSKYTTQEEIDTVLQVLKNFAEK